MADNGSSGGDVPTADASPNLGPATDTVLERVAHYVSADIVVDTLAKSLLKALSALVGNLPKLSAEFAGLLGKTLAALEEPFLPTLSTFTAPIVGGMFGADVDAGAFASRASSGDRNAAARAMVDAFISAITEGAAEPAEPTDEGAKALAAASLHASLEGWFLAAIPELLSDVIPFEMGHFEAFTKLPEDVVRALGVGRLVRRALTPLVNATATVPMTWFANKKYRPTKLGASTIARQLARGHWTYDQAYEEFARAGYSDQDIEALINEVAKFMSVAELDLLVRLGQIDRGAAVQHLQDAGWEADAAGSVFDIERFKRIESFELKMADAAVTSYADGRIDDATLDTYTHGTTIEQQQGAQLRELAAARKALRMKGLSPADAKACFLAGIVPISDYRAALDRDGYTPDAADALELLLRAEQDAKSTAAQHKTQMAADKAKAQQAKADAAAARQATIDATRAIKRQGSIATLERAVIDGLIPIARLQQVLAIDYDPDTVDIYVADVEARRAAHVAQLAKAAAAGTKAASKGLSISELTAAALENVLTVDQVGAHLAASGLDPADVDVLVATLRAKKAAHDAAVAKANQAATRAKTKGIDLSRLAQLVRLGGRTIADYDALLASLDYDEASRAELVQLLQLQIAKAQAGTSARAAIAAGNPAKALTLAQFRRAVIAGVRTLDDFQTFAQAQGYTSDAIATLTGELAQDVAAADAARARRTAAGTVLDGHGLPLADVTRAARLGTITPAAYAAELTARGYSADDVALELNLLTAEIGTAQATRQAQPTATSAAAAKGLSLGDLAKLAKAGEATVAEYQARALALGYSGDDAAALARLLQDELNTLAATSKRHVQISGELAARSLSLAELEAAVKGGQQTLDQYQQWLIANGFGAADAQLLRALLEAKLPAPAPAAGG